MGTEVLAMPDTLAMLDGAVGEDASLELHVLWRGRCPLLGLGDRDVLY